MAPGPDMAYMLARTITSGRKAGVLAAVGINAGAYVHLAAVVFGLSALLAESAVAFTVVKSIGACYLIWIGVRAIVSKSGPLKLTSGNVRPTAATKIFWQGFWCDVLNPKVAIFFLALLPQFVDVHSREAPVTEQLALLGVTCNVVAISINLALVHCASAATERLRRNTRVLAWLNKAMGAVLIALGLRLARERL